MEYEIVMIILYLIIIMQCEFMSSFQKHVACYRIYFLYPYKNSSNEYNIQNIYLLNEQELLYKKISWKNNSWRRDQYTYVHISSFTQ